jgi:hypothetical protein
MEWRRGSSGGVPALQVWSPEFKLQSHYKKKKKKVVCMCTFISWSQRLSLPNPGHISPIVHSSQLESENGYQANLIYLYPQEKVHSNVTNPT